MMTSTKTFYLKIFLIFIILLLLFSSNLLKESWFKSNEVKEKVISGEVFGVETYKITIVTNEKEQALDRFKKEVLDPFLKSYNQEFSTYLSDSYITKLNQAELNVSFPTSEYFDKAFEESLWANQETEGAFDPSIGSLINLWGFGEKKQELKDIPEDAIKEAKSQIGLDAFDWKKGSIQKKRKVSLNLSSVVEGYAVDLVAKLLEKEGYKNYLIDIGGENLAKGNKANGAPFVIGLEIPRDMNQLEDRKVQYKIQLKDSAVATSGNYKQFYIQNDKRYSHIIDPVSGYPAQNNLACVTVISKTCMRADTLSTAFMVMGFEKSLLYVNKHPEIDAIFTIRNKTNEFVSVMSVGFKKHLVK